MTSSEANNLADRFVARSAEADARGDKRSAVLWRQAAREVLNAEADSIAAAHKRSLRRRGQLGLRLTR